MERRQSSPEEMALQHPTADDVRAAAAVIAAFGRWEDTDQASDQTVEVVDAMDRICLKWASRFVRISSWSEHMVATDLSEDGGTR